MTRTSCVDRNSGGTECLPIDSRARSIGLSIITSRPKGSISVQSISNGSTWLLSLRLIGFVMRLGFPILCMTNKHVTQSNKTFICHVNARSKYALKRRIVNFTFNLNKIKFCHLVGRLSKNKVCKHTTSYIRVTCNLHTPIFFIHIFFLSKAESYDYCAHFHHI